MLRRVQWRYCGEYVERSRQRAAQVRSATPAALLPAMATRTTLVPLQQAFEIYLPLRRLRFMAFVDDVQLAFVNVDEVQNRGCWRRVMNMLASRVVPGYTHVEFVFTLAVRDGTPASASAPTPKKLYMSASILDGETLRMDIKLYDLDFYRMHRLELSQAQRDALFAQCRRDVVRTPPLRFNKLGFFCNFVLPRALHHDGGETHAFCSEYVVRTLQRLRICEADALVPYSTSPQMLYDHIAERDGFAVGIDKHLHAKTGPILV